MPNLNPETPTKEDIEQAYTVEKMRLHPGYAIVVEFWNAQREAIIAAGKAAAKKKNEFDARSAWCTLDGFDKACAIIDRIAERASKEVEKKELEQEGTSLANG